mgnify:CR=1 FL=1
MINKFDGPYAFLSNFYHSPIIYEGLEYPTVEHAFQAAKTLKMSERESIAALPTPGAAKRAGRQVSLRKDWEEVKKVNKEIRKISLYDNSVKSLFTVDLW